MSNGINGLFTFIEQGTDPRVAPGFDAPVNALCTFGGALLRKSGEAPTDWEDAGGGGGGGGFTGGTVPNPTTFQGAVTFQDGVDVGSSTDTAIFRGPVQFDGVIEAWGQSGHLNETVRWGMAASTLLLGFFNQAPAAQIPIIADPSGGVTTDAECRTALVAVMNGLRSLGLIDT